MTRFHRMLTSQFGLLLVATLACLVLLLSSRNTPAATAAPVAHTFDVNSTADLPDLNPGNGQCDPVLGNPTCTLRAAIMEANALAGADTIVLHAGTYLLTRAGADDNALNGDLDITDTLTIRGDSVLTTFIDGNGAVTGDRVFEILSPNAIAVNMSDLTIRHGAAPNQGGGIFIQTSGTLTLSNTSVFSNTASAGGGIENTLGTLNLLNSALTDNAAGFGGGMHNFGTVKLLSSTVSGNVGGGIANDTVSNIFGDLTVLNSTISTNQSTVFGAGIYNLGSLHLSNSTLSLNSTTSDGGGIFSDNTATLVNSTISQNSAANGGGIYNSGSLSLHSVTIHANFGVGGGIHSGTLLTATNTILADNRLGVFSPRSDCSGQFTSQGYNLITSTTGCTILNDDSTNLKDVDAKMDFLQNNGGATQTVALFSDSPAIGAGDPGGCRDANHVLLPTDQRGFLRQVGARCDIGAYEFARLVFLPLIVR